MEKTIDNILIITSYVEGTLEEIKNLIKQIDYDYVICADAGYKIAEKIGIKSDLVVGDFDSSNGDKPKETETIVVPVEKDDTDLQLALKIAQEKNAKKVVIIGGIGGRVDHTFGNVQNMVHYSEEGMEIIMVDPFQSITVQRPGTRIYKGNKNTKFSVFAHSPEVTGITYKGAYYPLTNHTITNSFPLGISNEFVSDKIKVTIKTGTLIVVRTML